MATVYPSGLDPQHTQPMPQPWAPALCGRAAARADTFSMLHIDFNPDLDAIHIQLTQGRAVARTDRLTADVSVSYDERGEVLGFAMYNARGLLGTTRSLPQIKVEGLSVRLD